MKAIQPAMAMSPTVPSEASPGEPMNAPSGFADRLREAFEAALHRSAEPEGDAETKEASAEATAKDPDAALDVRTGEEEDERDDDSLLATNIFQTLREMTRVPKFEEASTVATSRQGRSTTLRFFGAVNTRPTVPAPPPDGAHRTPTVRPAPEGLVSEPPEDADRSALETSWTEALRATRTFENIAFSRAFGEAVAPRPSPETTPRRPDLPARKQAMFLPAQSAAAQPAAAQPAPAFDAASRNETSAVHHNETARTSAPRMGLSQVDVVTPKPSMEPTSTTTSTSTSTSNTASTSSSNVVVPTRRDTAKLGSIRIEKPGADAPAAKIDPFTAGDVRLPDTEDRTLDARVDLDRLGVHPRAANETQHAPIAPSAPTGERQEFSQHGRETREARADEIARNLDTIELNGKVRIAADAGDLGRIQIEARRDAEGRIEIDLSSTREATSAALEVHRPEMQREASRGELRGASVTVQSGGQQGSAMGQRHDGRQRADTSRGDTHEDPAHSPSRRERARRVRIVL